MGWWSTDIMGGDTPLDFKSEIIDEFLKKDQFHDGLVKIKEAFDRVPEKGLNGLIPHIVRTWGYKVGDSSYVDEVSIGYQVLAVLMMKCGATIPDSTRVLMRESISQDGWATENEERKGKIEFLLQSLASYNGTPIHIKSKGLIETWEEKMKNKS